MAQPPNPIRIRELATNVGRLLTDTFNEYEPSYKDAYYGSNPERALERQWQLDLRQTLTIYAQDLEHFQKRLTAMQKGVASAYGRDSALPKRLCVHCDERQVEKPKGIKTYDLCGFCADYRRANGKLPSREILNGIKRRGGGKPSHSTEPCSVPGCPNFCHCKGLCRNHYSAAWYQRQKEK